jgi:hypothetical protein
MAITFSPGQPSYCAIGNTTPPSRNLKESSPMHDTCRTAYLFQSHGEDLYAVTHDITGHNIPRSPCTKGWRLCEAFQLGVHAPVPVPIMAEAVLEGIANTSFYVWRGWSAALPHGQ